MLRNTEEHGYIYVYLLKDKVTDATKY